MRGISDFLAKFKVIPNPRDEKKIVSEIISGQIKCEVLESSVDFSRGCIKVDVHPAIKNLIFQHKIEILEQINKRFNGEKTFVNIV